MINEIDQKNKYAQFQWIGIRAMWGSGKDRESIGVNARGLILYGNRQGFTWRKFEWK